MGRKAERGREELRVKEKRKKHKNPLTGRVERGNIIKLSQTAGENLLRQSGEKKTSKKVEKDA